MPKVYYNENNDLSAKWLKQLIQNNLIADGEVDDRSIIDVEPSDLKGYRQHHFFAGVGGWSYALRLAGWADDRPVCSASLPCQPFSCAGKQQGKDDERHLLPHFIELVKQCNFKTIFGEQVPGAIKHGWLDDLCFEMEREGYAIGQIVLTAAGSGAAHIRQRLYWVANSGGKRYAQQPGNGSISPETNGNDEGEGSERSSGVVYTNESRSQSRWELTKTTGYRGSIKSTSGIGRMGDTESQRRSVCNSKHIRQTDGEVNTSANASDSADQQSSEVQIADSGEWDNPEWIYCRDNKYRPIKPGIKPLVDGLSERMVRSGDPGAPIDADNTQEARVMRLKGYGNAIVPQVAASFIQAFMNLSN